jgi:MFS transporter, DHA2 family, methylenomycin A resistance protein
VVGLLVNLCFYGLIFVFSLLFQTAHHLSALQTGLAFLPMTGAILAANILTGRLTGRFGSQRVMLAGLATMVIACVGLATTGADTGYAPILIEQALLGGGLGLLVPPMTSTLLTSVDRSRSGVASGTLTTLRQTGSMIGVALFGSFIAGAGHIYSGLHTAVAVSLVVLLASLLLVAQLGADRISRSRIRTSVSRGPRRSSSRRIVRSATRLRSRSRL